MNDQYFAAVLNVRSSALDPKWIIFTTQPYLPVTDPAYGFATVLNKRWVVVDFGTALVGCANVPIEVEKEFGFTCP
jgi:pantothenate kinase type III